MELESNKVIFLTTRTSERLGYQESQSKRDRALSRALRKEKYISEKIKLLEEERLNDEEINKIEDQMARIRKSQERRQVKYKYFQKECKEKILILNSEIKCHYGESSNSKVQNCDKFKEKDKCEGLKHPNLKCYENIDKQENTICEKIQQPFLYPEEVKTISQASEKKNSFGNETVCEKKDDKDQSMNQSITESFTIEDFGVKKVKDRSGYVEENNVETILLNICEEVDDKKVLNEISRLNGVKNSLLRNSELACEANVDKGNLRKLIAKVTGEIRICLMRFCEMKIGFIETTFHQVKIQKEDLPNQRILWKQIKWKFMSKDDLCFEYLEIRNQINFCIGEEYVADFDDKN